MVCDEVNRKDVGIKRKDALDLPDDRFKNDRAGHPLINNFSVDSHYGASTLVPISGLATCAFLFLLNTSGPEHSITDQIVQQPFICRSCLRNSLPPKQIILLPNHLMGPGRRQRNHLRREPEYTMLFAPGRLACREDN